MFPRLLIAIGLLGAASLPSIGWAQEPEIQYFTETGYSVRGEFLQFFNSHGRTEIFGPPISPERIEDGVRVQYFRNVRLEWHPENPRPYRVQPGLLGELINGRQPPIPSSQIPPANRANERYYPETGHTVKFGFLAFFDAHGGIDLFGYPISEAASERGKLVQWFQRVKFEWQPDGEGGRVVLTPLGEIMLAKKHPDWAPDMSIHTKSFVGRAAPTELQPTSSLPNLVTPLRPLSLKVNISLKNTIMDGQKANEQRVVVFVNDDQNNPIPGASIRLVVRYPTGQQEYQLPPTDGSGMVVYQFPISKVDPGKSVVVRAQASYAEQTASTEYSFLSWY